MRVQRCMLYRFTYMWAALRPSSSAAYPFHHFEQIIHWLLFIPSKKSTFVCGGSNGPRDGGCVGILVGLGGRWIAMSTAHVCARISMRVRCVCMYKYPFMMWMHAHMDVGRRRARYICRPSPCLLKLASCRTFQ